MKGAANMIVLYILFGIFLFLLLLTLLPVRVAVTFQEEFSIELRYLFFRKTLQAGKEPEQEELEEAKDKTEAEEKAGRRMDIKQLLTRRGFSGFFQALGEVLGLVGRCSRRLLRRLRLRQFDLYLCLGGAGDAASAALMYGKVAAGVYSVCGELFALMPCKEKGVTVDLDFDGIRHRVDFSAQVSMRPIFLIKEGLILLIKGLFPVKRMLQILTSPKQKAAPIKSAANE